MKGMSRACANPAAGLGLRVFQSEHQLFPAMYSQCLADSWGFEAYIIHILTLACGRLLSPGKKKKKTLKKLFSCLCLFFKAVAYIFFCQCRRGAKSYQCGDCVQRGRSRLQTKHQPYHSSRRVYRRSQGQVSSLQINTGNKVFQGSVTGNAAPNKRQTPDNNFFVRSSLSSC